ncbi:MAG: 2-succinyl-5-enolpyruvyl-6-hydroxy-3-cyclohexene-1-carboxylate synthase [Flavobacteriales bacterium]|jgi:2-succinyl-5-enolpyruvyl-6-hydroxy-3-cyclohexene-1-carboxylate synthase
MQSDKSVVRDLVSILVTKGLKHVVLSPGSRHAPISISFYNHPDITCHVIPDERAAAYFAIGIIQETKSPVACVCTSGTALANYSSAAAEALYQELPLLLISADRPIEWVDQGDGQTIRQAGLLSAHCLASLSLDQNDDHADVRWFNQREINRTWNLAIGTPNGPIHINVPLREPLYQSVETAEEYPLITVHTKPEQLIVEHKMQEFRSQIRSHDKVLLIVGLNHPDAALSEAIGTFSLLPQVTVLTETTSNVKHGETISCIDRLLMSFNNHEQLDFVPDLLITIGTHIISKKVKALLRKEFKGAHWHVDPAGAHMDSFKRLQQIVQTNPTSFINALAENTENTSDYHQKWYKVHELAASIQAEVVSSLPWCDMKVFSHILPKIPNNTTLQMGNSSVVRYIQLYNMNNALNYYGNRGTSGIDGCTSTAAGMAVASKKTITLITGDIAFLYDLNGLWHQSNISNLKIILINNGGGGIFKIIDGPRSTNALEEVFEAKHNLNGQHLAQHFGINYTTASNQNELEEGMAWLYGEGVKILEVDTKSAANDEQLRHVFKEVKERIRA